MAATVADAVKAQAQNYSWSAGRSSPRAPTTCTVKTQFGPRDSVRTPSRSRHRLLPRDSRGIATGEADDCRHTGGHFRHRLGPLYGRTVSRRVQPETYARRPKTEEPGELLFEPGPGSGGGNVTANLAVVGWTVVPRPTKTQKERRVDALYRWLPDHATYGHRAEGPDDRRLQGLHTIETSRWSPAMARVIQDMGFPGARMAGPAIVRKGNVCRRHLQYVGRRHEPGTWWDDMPFLQAHVRRRGMHPGHPCQPEVVADGTSRRSLILPWPCLRAALRRLPPACRPRQRRPRQRRLHRAAQAAHQARAQTRPPTATWDPAGAVREPGARQAGVAIEPGLRRPRRPGRRRHSDGAHRGSAAQTDAGASHGAIDLGASPRIDRVAVWSGPTAVASACRNSTSWFQTSRSPRAISRSASARPASATTTSKAWPPDPPSSPLPGPDVMFAPTGRRELSQHRRVGGLQGWDGRTGSADRQNSGGRDSTTTPPGGDDARPRRGGSGESCALDGAFNPASITPSLVRRRSRRPSTGPQPCGTWAKGNTVATCETKWIRRVYATGPQQTTGAVVEAFMAFTFDGTVYNLPP